MIFGYARVSTKEQNLESQKEELNRLGVDKIFSDKASGKNKDRPEFKKLLEQLREGDTLLVTKIDRLARSLQDLIFLLDLFSQQQIKVQIGSLKIDFTTAEGRLYASLFGAIAQFERELLSERTKIGLESARAKGRIGGKPKGLSEEAKKQAKKAYELKELGLTTKEIMLATKIKSSRTLYKYIRHHAEELALEKGLKLSDDGLTIKKEN